MHNNTPIVPYISLCSGYEGIGLGLHRCIPNLRCISYCEREAYAIANLVAKMEKGLLDAAPVFTDVTTFPWEQFAPYMAGGILSFGWPCQPVSMAGKRKATEDERWLFDIIADGISILKPGMLFAENVEGLLSAKMPDGSLVFSHCIERLERLHYKVEAGIFSASEVGAPHQRKRVFILAYDKSLGIQGCWPSWIEESRPHAGQTLPVRGGNAGCNELAYDSSERLSLSYGQRNEPEGQRDAEFECCGNNAWPSRPGEPQHGWEPPRVVANAERTANRGQAAGDEADWQDTERPAGGISGSSNGKTRALADNHRPHARHGEQRPERTPRDLSGGCGESMGNATDDGRQHDKQSAQGRWAATVAESSQCELGYSTSERPHRGGEDGLGLQPEMLGEGYEAMGDTKSRRTGGCGNKDSEREGLGFIGTSPSGGMGDPKQLLLPTTREHGTMDEASGIPANGKGSEPAQTDPESSATREREGYGSNASECSEIKFSMGDPVDEPSIGMGLSELSGLSHSELAEIREWMVKTDNRTDELRLLGNGVVPATAERAFLTLLEKLTK